MIRCNNCPCFAPPTIPPTKIICGITGWELTRVGMYDFQQDEANCPLKRLELKTGEVFEPEVIDG
jgi:hypothetical protein